ncbi:hypothetical protein KR038_006820, partial [Drosophila bunnanda]
LGNRYYLEKQQFLLEILNHVSEPLMNEQWRLLGQQLVTDKEQYVVYNERMTRFHDAFKLGKLLPREASYNPLNADHYEQTLGLYTFFYNTRDWYTLWQNICWARMYINPGIFVQALMQVLLKREDYQALIMPKVYELWPESYHDAVTVSEARKFNFANFWSIQENEQDIIEEVHPQEMEPFALEGGPLRNSQEWLQAMADVNILRMKEKPQQSRNKLKHLLEDIGWQSYWYYLNMGIVLAKEESQDQLQEWWYYQLSQILARYKLERYGQQLPYKKLSLDNDNYKITKIFDEYLKKLESLVDEAIASRSYIQANGSFINLDVENNWLIGLRELFPYDWTQFVYEDAEFKPQLLLDPRTSLRSEYFYYFAERLLHCYYWYRQAFQSNNIRKSYIPKDLSITDVEISPLITYDQPVDVDLSNLLHEKHFYIAGQFMWPFTLHKRQYRLQQMDFSYTLDVSSNNRTQSVIFRTFLTTSVTGSVHREPFYHLDSFLTVLYPGLNRITRESKEFNGLIGDHISLTELYKFVKLAERDDYYEFPMNISTPNCGFPRRLILPRGGQGNPVRMRLMIVATSYDFKACQGNELNCDFSKGISRWDELPLGYPFDKLMAEDSSRDSEIFGEYAYWKEVEIVHED